MPDNTGSYAGLASWSRRTSPARQEDPVEGKEYAIWGIYARGACPIYLRQ